MPFACMLAYDYFHIQNQFSEYNYKLPVINTYDILQTGKKICAETFDHITSSDISVVYMSGICQVDLSFDVYDNETEQFLRNVSIKLFDLAINKNWVRVLFLC